MSQMHWRLAGTIVALAAGLGAARAAPLDEAACSGIKAEREGLVAKGLEADIARGAEWGKANLPPDRLKEVARLIELNEQLIFRCGQLTVTRPDGKPLLKKEPPPVPAAAVPASGGEQAKPAAKKKKKATTAAQPAGTNVPQSPSGAPTP